MPWNGSSVFQLPAGYLATSFTTARASQHNIPLEDVEAALNRTLYRGGGTHMDSGASFNLGRNAATALEPVPKQQFDLAALKANNLNDLANASTALTNLGGGTAGKAIFGAASMPDARALLAVESGYPIRTHSFPTDAGNTGIEYFQNAEGEWFAALVYEGKITSSLEIYAETSPGHFGGSPVATYNIEHPHGVRAYLKGGVVWLGVTSYRRTTGYSALLKNYYDSTSYIFEFRRVVGPPVSYVLDPVFPFATYGAKRLEFYDHSDGSLYATVANSVSDSRNTSGNPAYNGCTEQSVMVLKLTGAAWAIQTDMPCGGSPYHAFMYENGATTKLSIARYYDAGAVSGAANTMRYRVKSLIVPKVGSTWSVANATHEVPTKGASSSVVVVKDGRELAFFGFQRDDGAFGGVDKTHFNMLCPGFELMGNGRVEPLKWSVPCFNTYMVRKTEVESSTLLHFCNGSSGGGYPTNFNEGGISTYRVDERTFQMMAVNRIPAVGSFDVAVAKRGDIHILLAACGAAGENGSYTSTTPSYAFNIGDLLASGSERDTSDLPIPFAARRRLGNGSMQVAQVNGINPGTADGYEVADRWRLRHSGLTGTATVQRYLSPTINGSPARVDLTMTTACSVSASGWLAIERELRGYDIDDLRWNDTTGSAAMLRFMFRSNIACKIAVQLENAAGTYVWTQIFEITADDAASNGAETIQQLWIEPPLRSTGGWGTGSSVAGYLRFVIAAGASVTGSKPGWRSGSHKAAPGITNSIGTVAKYFQISEVELIKDQHWHIPNAQWECPSYVEDLSAMNGLTLSLADNSVSNAALRDSVALSVIGRGSNTSGDPADIAALSDGHYLRRSGGVLAFGAPPASDIVNTPAGGVAATNVQAAINELDTEKAALAGATFTGTINGTTVSMTGNIQTSAGDVTGLAFNSSVTGTAEQYTMVARRSGVARGYLAFTNADMFQIYLYNSSGVFLSNPLKAYGNGSIQVDGPMVMKSYAKASLPAAGSFTAGFIYVTDDVGGATPAFSDGTNWRRVADRAVIS